jgi:acetoacetate decarboxylase
MVEGIWPSPIGAWPSAPWTMTGRMVTGYFHLPWSIVSRITHPSLLPEQTDVVESRIRFYQLYSNGHAFREAVMGSPVRYQAIDGECTFLIWSDSETYQTWGRETFGWPILRGAIKLNGTLWHQAIGAGATGTSRLECPDGTILLDVHVGIQPSSTRLNWPTRRDWLSPRRIVRRAGLDAEEREVFRLRPTLNRPGDSYAGSGAARFQFAHHHPLHELGELQVEIEVIDGFEMIVGDRVEIIGTA